MFTSKKREGMKRFACDVSLNVTETHKASIKYHKPPLPIIPIGIVAYGFVGQPFSKQLYTCVYTHVCACIDIGVYAKYAHIIRVCIVQIYPSCTVHVCLSCRLKTETGPLMRPGAVTAQP